MEKLVFNGGPVALHIKFTVVSAHHFHITIDHITLAIDIAECGLAVFVHTLNPFAEHLGTVITKIIGAVTIGDKLVLHHFPIFIYIAQDRPIRVINNGIQNQCTVPFLIKGVIPITNLFRLHVITGHKITVFIDPQILSPCRCHLCPSGLGRQQAFSSIFIILKEIGLPAFFLLFGCDLSILARILQFSVIFKECIGDCFPIAVISKIAVVLTCCLCLLTHDDLSVAVRITEAAILVSYPFLCLFLPILANMDHRVIQLDKLIFYDLIRWIPVLVCFIIISFFLIKHTVLIQYDIPASVHSLLGCSNRLHWFYGLGCLLFFCRLILRIFGSGLWGSFRFAVSGFRVPFCFAVSGFRVPLCFAVSGFRVPLCFAVSSFRVLLCFAVSGFRLLLCFAVSGSGISLCLLISGSGISFRLAISLFRISFRFSISCFGVSFFAFRFILCLPIARFRIVFPFVLFPPSFVPSCRI